MKRIAFFFFLASLIIAPLSAFAGAKEREEKPLQFALNMYGGGTIGYHFNSVVYLGLLQTNGFSNTTETSPQGSEETSGTYRYYGYDGASNQSVSQSMRQGVELRLTPWDVGFYIAAGFIKQGAEGETVRYDKRNRLLGENVYNTGFDAEISYPEYQGPVGGIGWNGVAESGFVFTVGFLAGAGGEQENAKVKLSNWDDAPTDDDKATVKDEITYHANQRGGNIFLIAVGYTF